MEKFLDMTIKKDNVESSSQKVSWFLLVYFKDFKFSLHLYFKDFADRYRTKVFFKDVVDRSGTIYL